MLCPSCDKENGGRFGDLCPACEAWIATRQQPDREPEDTGGATGKVLAFVAHSTRRLREARRFFASVHW